MPAQTRWCDSSLHLVCEIRLTPTRVGTSPTILTPTTLRISTLSARRTRKATTQLAPARRHQLSLDVFSSTRTRFHPRCIFRDSRIFRSRATHSPHLLLRLNAASPLRSFSRSVFPVAPPSARRSALSSPAIFLGHSSAAPPPTITLVHSISKAFSARSRPSERPPLPLIPCVRAHVTPPPLFRAHLSH